VDEERICRALIENKIDPFLKKAVEIISIPWTYVIMAGLSEKRGERV